MILVTCLTILLIILKNIRTNESYSKNSCASGLDSRGNPTVEADVITENES